MVVLSGESVQSLGYEAHLEEMGSWGVGFESHSLDLPSDFSLFPLCEDVSKKSPSASTIAVSGSCCHDLPAMMVCILRL